MDRLENVPEICKRWSGPIELVVYQRASDATSLPFGLSNITCKAMHSQVVVGPFTGEPYPINRLRNLGIDSVRTSHLLLVDVDFLPSETLYGTLIHVARKSRSLLDRGKVLVVPAFRMMQVSKQCSFASDSPCFAMFSRHTPKKFEELMVCIAHNTCRIFDFGFNPRGHESTDYPRWVAQQEHEVRAIKCFDSNKYEPYFVLDKRSGHRYDENFVGYGKNKIELVMRLRAAGSHFYVVPRAFFIHLPHRESEDKEHWLVSRKKHFENEQLLRKAVRQLRAGNVTTPLCSSSAATASR